MREVFPGATHDRWSHALGVFSAIVGYYNSLLSDPEVPTFRILVDQGDVSHAFVAAILHDLGQTSFGHDFEEVCPYLLKHEKVISRLLKEEHWGKPTLSETIKRSWPDVDLHRVLAILGAEASHVEAQPSSGIGNGYRPVDGVAADAINGPIDADKLDYLLRDSIACGVPYGHGMDVHRFLQALTVTAMHSSAHGARLALGYKAKGRASIASILLARYQMWGAVYWHHTFRCIQGMFVHAASATFGPEWTGTKELRKQKFTVNTLRDVLYWRLLCRKSWQQCDKLSKGAFPLAYVSEPPALVSAEPALEFIWQFSPDSIRPLVEALAARHLFKRVFELRLGQLGERADYSAMKTDLSPEARVARAQTLQQYLLDQVLNKMRQRGPSESVSESAAKQRHERLVANKSPLLILDFPVRGISQELNTPKEMGDAARKYSAIPAAGQGAQDDLFHVVRKLQEHMATIRVFAAPDFQELITRYLDPADIHSAVERVVPTLRTQQ